MRAVPIHAFFALLSFPLVAALGCANESNEHANYANNAPMPAATQPSKVAEKRPSNETASGLRMGHLDDEHNHGPVSLTGENSYLERFDPSGWSGTSMPKGIGGGPPAEGLAPEAPENPYEQAAPTDEVPNPPASNDDKSKSNTEGEMGY